MGNEIDCFGTGQDGELRAGVPWPDPRFIDNLDGTVIDRLTGLIWLQDTSCLGSNWPSSLLVAAALTDSQCGLTDLSSPGDWRVPNIGELRSLFDHQVGGLPANHPFITVGTNRFFWSSTTDTLNSDLAFVQNFGNPIGFGGENDRLLKCCVAASVIAVRNAQ